MPVLGVPERRVIHETAVTIDGAPHSGGFHMAYQTPLTIKTVLQRIENQEYVIPAIQREFVWAPAQMCSLFDSLLRRYPIGTFLFWRISPDDSADYRFYEVMRDYHERKNSHSPVIEFPAGRPVTAILDGQQRLTTLNIALNGSYAVKRARAGASGDTHPVTRMYLDLTHDPEEGDESGVKYLFRFLPDEEAQRARGHAWFLAADAFHMESGREINRRIQAAGLADHPTAYDTLYSLWEAITQVPCISYFELDETDLTKVLEIFIRVNSGGTVLSKSDLLLSVATARFTERDARETIHGLVDDLNATGRGFSFTKDRVLKAGLLLTNRPSVAVEPKTLTPESVALIDQSWDRIEAALRNAVHLLDAFGFSARTLPAASIIFPLATYFDVRGLDYAYVTSAGHRADREVVRQWVLRMLLAPGMWGSNLNKLITLMRAVIQEHGTGGFPARELERTIAQMGKSLVFTREHIEQLADTKSRNSRAYVLLSLLYPAAAIGNDLHVDHVFPKKLFTKRALGAAGVDPAVMDDLRDVFDRLGNLQLLRGSVNTSKQAMLPMDWARDRFPDPGARTGYLAENDMHDLPDDIASFSRFYDQRRARMIGRLGELLDTGNEPGVGSETGARGTDPADGYPSGTALVTSRSAPTSARKPPVSASPASVHAPRPRPARTARTTTGGPRRTFNRSLANVPDGPIEYRVHGITYVGRVDGAGIILEDGHRFSSPSAAGRAVNGGTSVNGWQAWSRDGVELRDLHP